MGAYLRKGRGAVLAVPNLDLGDDDRFLEERDVDGESGFYWTESGVAFGKRLITTLVAMADALASEVVGTPAPDWVQEDRYRLSAELEIEKKISEIIEKVTLFESERRELDIQLRSAGALRDLLFEQGKPLEGAVLEALGLLGFDAKGFQDADSEFDAIFTSPEGRFLGEVEGRDNRPINIDKFSQLERNLNEDFARDEVAVFAKGVLFGNGFRLQAPAMRGDPFTEKCRTAAVRIGAALVNTPDLFSPCQYLKSHKDLDYAKKCREAMLNAMGAIVAFPAPPIEAVLATEIKEIQSQEAELDSIELS